MDAGTFVPASRMTVGEYLADWLASLPTRGLRPRTLETYSMLLRLHVLPNLGEVRLQSLSVLELDKLYARLRTEGSVARPGQPLSARTVRIVHTIVRKALADAERKGLVVRNVADLASPPSNKAAKAPEAQIWTPDELRTFLDRVRERPLYPLWRLAAMTGMRRGELCGLRWSDVDLDAGRLVVRQQSLNLKGDIVFSDLKTDAARRSIDMDPETVAVLRAHRARQAEWRLAVGPGWRDSGLMFTQVDGSPLDPSQVTKLFSEQVRRSGLPKIRLHDLRHSHTTHLIAAGEQPRTISARLGHSSVIFTQDRYGHLLPNAQATAATAVAALVDGLTALSGSTQP